MSKDQLYVLLVDGGEFAAMEFEDENKFGYSHKNRLRLVKTMLENDTHFVTLNEFDKNKEIINVRLHSFGKVDSNFIDFMRDNFQDYDRSKSREFYTFTPKELENIIPFDSLDDKCGFCKKDITKKCERCDDCDNIFCKKCLFLCSFCKSVYCQNCKDDNLYKCKPCKKYSCMNCLGYSKKHKNGHCRFCKSEIKIE